MKISTGKKFIEIANPPILTSAIVVALLENINKHFLINQPISELTKMVSFSENDVVEYRKCYSELNANFAFEDFLSLAALSLGDVDIYSVDDNTLVGKVDFSPDGDWDKIWIDIINPKYRELFLKTIKDFVLSVNYIF